MRVTEYLLRRIKIIVSSDRYKELKLGVSQKLYNDAKKVIPGGTQLLSKRPEMYAPNIWPAYYSEAKGVKVKDLDGREYIDMSTMSVGACILGYADDDVDYAVQEAIKKGINSSLNCPEEVELANLMLELHPWFDMIRYARSGGEAMSIAVRIARAHNKREKVLFSGYHGWCDWYISSNIADKSSLDGQLMPGLEPDGIPRGLQNTAIPFNAGDIDELKSKVVKYKDQISSIVIEPARGIDADDSYLKSLNEFAHEIGAVVIYDEITSAMRLCPGGIHRIYDTKPDMAVYAKSISNGYAMSIIAGSSKVMESAQDTFISSTNWTERIGPVAAITTIKKYINNNVQDHLINMGEKVRNIWQTAAQRNKIEISTSGISSLQSFGFNSSDVNKYNSIFVSEMLLKNFLAFRQFKPSFAHQNEHLESYENAVNEVFSLISNLKDEDLVNIPEAHSGFYRLTKE